MLPAFPCIRNEDPHRRKREGVRRTGSSMVAQNKQSHVSSCHAVIFWVCPPHSGLEADSHPGNIPSTIINSLQNNVLLSCSCKTPSYIFWPLAKASLSLRIPNVPSYYGNLQVDIFLAQRKTVHLLNKCLWNSCQERPNTVPSNWEYKIRPNPLFLSCVLGK